MRSMLWGHKRAHVFDSGSPWENWRKECLDRALKAVIRALALESN